ncbi:hypothetical protein EDB84DRAFT_1438730 [Lactarius hengduanensis]|nr:hypothetical protein EDB84DRAFT_1438730 [Lactarius hengduanensis]
MSSPPHPPRFLPIQSDELTPLDNRRITRQMREWSTRPLPFDARDDSPDTRQDTYGLPGANFGPTQNPTSYLRHYTAQGHRLTRLQRAAAEHNAQEHTEGTRYADDVPLDVELGVFVPGDASVEEVYAALAPVFVPVPPAPANPVNSPLVLSPPITSEPTELTVYSRRPRPTSLASSPPYFCHQLSHRRTTHGGDEYRGPRTPPRSQHLTHRPRATRCTPTPNPVGYITVPPPPDTPPSPSPSPNPIREDNDHPGPGWLVYVPDDPRMPPVNIPTGRGGYEVARYVRYVIDQFDEPVSMGTRGRGQPHYGGVLTAQNRPRDHNPNIRDDHLYSLHADFSHTREIDLALTSLGDPGVLADVHRLRRSLAQKRELLQSQHTLELAWKDWSSKANEVDRRLIHANVISCITPMLSPNIRPGLLPVANPTGDDVERHLGAHHVLNNYPPPVPVLRIPNSLQTAAPPPRFTMTEAPRTPRFTMAMDERESPTSLHARTTLPMVFYQRSHFERLPRPSWALCLKRGAVASLVPTPTSALATSALGAGPHRALATPSPVGRAAAPAATQASSSTT